VDRRDRSGIGDSCGLELAAPGHVRELEPSRWRSLASALDLPHDARGATKGSCYHRRMKRWLVVLLLVVAVRPVFADDDDPMYTCKVATGKIRAYFKPEVELKDLVSWMMGFSCKTVILGAGVDGGTKVTIVAPSPMTVKQALKLFADAVDAAGFVVQDKGDDLVIKVGPGSVRPCGGGPATKATKAPKTVDATDSSKGDALMIAGIKKIDDTHYEVAASVIDALVKDPKAVGKGARIVPALEAGKPDGFKLYAIWPGSFYARIGLANGDTLRTVNGLELTSADKALEVYAKLREATMIELEIERHGKPLTITVTVK
jgi:hypothetical protein